MNDGDFSAHEDHMAEIARVLNDSIEEEWAQARLHFSIEHGEEGEGDVHTFRAEFDPPRSAGLLGYFSKGAAPEPKGFICKSEIQFVIKAWRKALKDSGQELWMSGVFTL